MILKNKLSIYLIILFSVANAFAQSNNSISKAHKYLLENKLDSLNSILKNIPSTVKNGYFKNISSNKASTQDYINLLEGYSLTEKKYLSLLNRFINNKVKEPATLEKVNLEFVKVKWFQILTLLNDEKIDLAATESKKLSSYISRIKQKNNTEYKKAIIYARLFPIVTLMIQKDIKEGKKLCLLSLQEAEKLQDDFLTIFSKNYLNEFLVLEDDLDEFIKNCKEIFVLEAKQKQKTIFYEPNIQHYLDAVIYKGNFDEIEVENLLNELYTTENSKYTSYVLYAKYMEYNAPNSSACKRIYAKFKVKNLVELCDFFIKDAKDKLNLYDLNNLYDECSDACYEHKFLDNAYTYKHHNQLLTEKIYSSELSQSLADFKTQEKDLENAKLKQVNTEKENTLSKQRILILGISIGLLILSILAYFLYNSIKQRNKINAKLDSANKDLNRLNVLNQKIFSVISHDFKGPITTLKMMLSKEDIINQSSSISTYLKDIKQQLDQSDNMLNSLLDWAKTELMVNIANKNEINLKNTVATACNELSAKAQDKKITLNNTIPEGSTANFNASVLGIVLRNVLSNAIKFSFENTEIDIFYAENSLFIKDYGKGIDAKKLEKLFKQNLNPGLGTHFESGFGIGLYLCQELMIKNNGILSVENNQTEGCTFRITLSN
jgi:signal transduction histidine kinase